MSVGQRAAPPSVCVNYVVLLSVLGRPSHTLRAPTHHELTLVWARAQMMRVRRCNLF